jgi:hypothetical protein
MLERFQLICDRPPIVKCYKNKLIYGCSYNNEVEEIIKKIEDTFIESVSLPWWLELLD